MRPRRFSEYCGKFEGKLTMSIPDAKVKLKGEVECLVYYAPRVCSRCGSEFRIAKCDYKMRPRPVIPTHNELGEPIVKRKNQKICPACADARKKRKKEGKWQKICKQCGDSFFSIRRDAITCGDACRQAYSRARKLKE